MSRLIRSFVICSLFAVAVGCNSSTDPMNLYTRLAGRVVDAETGKPISGVVVKVCNYEVQASTDGDGHWSIEIIPGLEDDNIHMTFERSGYASTGFGAKIFPDDALTIQNRDYHDLGTTMMRAGAPVTVQVTRDGAPFPAATLYAVLDDFVYDGTPCSDLNVLATANASGVATLSNLDPKRDYLVVVPMQDTNGDNIPDTTEADVWINIGYYGSVYAINVQSMKANPDPYITATNLAQTKQDYDGLQYIYYYNTYRTIATGTIDGNDPGAYGMADLYYRWYNQDNGSTEFVEFGTSETEQVGFRNAVITPNHSVQIVFMTPVDISEQNFLYLNNLVAVTDPNFNRNLHIPGTATALPGSNFTVYNFVPAVQLPSNEVVTLNFIARSRVNSASSRNLSVTFYVPLALPAITVAADNFNGSRDGTGGYGQVYLRFPELVEGFYKVISFVEDGTTYDFEDPNEMWIANNEYSGNGYPQYHLNTEIVNNQDAAPATGENVGQSGAVAGKQFLVELVTPDFSHLFLDDDVPGTQVYSVRVELSVCNILGVTLDTVVDLPIE